MAITLNSLNQTLSTTIVAPENNLTTRLANLGSGAQLGVTDMVSLQKDMADYTMIGNLMSAVMKDIVDTLKGVVQRVG